MQKRLSFQDIECTCNGVTTAKHHEQGSPFRRTFEEVSERNGVQNAKFVTKC